MDDQVHHEAHRLASLVGVVFGVLLHLMVGFFVLFTGLIAPPWAAATLITVWIGMGWLLWRWRHTPIRALLVPVVTAAIWFAAITAGDVWLGWTA